MSRFCYVNIKDQSALLIQSVGEIWYEQNLKHPGKWAEVNVMSVSNIHVAD
jgi:hypothetical protein